ncbi:DUF4381 domain-containing protein [Thalassotalea sp. LPB0316]|uniref:DUF4381 domain-containing protein n=1 Tax=Thalassotalea sp. LPB0316 TaxID=2769490 RepID=UPI001868BEC3|nr:DUF4381 domain-containing protein [Thalassotalea sp. LPB0316]QOL25093.1 DUF4381 domain-containing protein [Thalassotalea sp. LPB0316]
MSQETVPIEMPFGNYALQGMSEIALPDPLPILPLAPAWKYVFILLTAYLVYRIVKQTIYAVNNRYRKQAKQQLMLLAANTPSHAGLSDMAQLLKGTSLYVFERDQIASLTGRQWFDLLNQQANQEVFDDETVNLLSANLYKKPSEEVDAAKWQQIVSQITTWLTVHPYTGVRPLVKPITLPSLKLLRGQKDV